MGDGFNAAQLRAARLRAGLTQDELAAQLRARNPRLRVQNQRVSGWEQGRQVPRPHVVGLLREILNMGPSSADSTGDLRGLRARSGLTVREVAAAVERTQRTVFRWESGQATPSRADRQRLADVFNVDVATVDRALTLAGGQSGR